MDKKNKILIIIISVVILAIVVGGVFTIISIISTNGASNANEDIYNKTLYVNTTLPDIAGSENVVQDEFGKRTNNSVSLKATKKWMNLDFTEFNVYSLNSNSSVITFKISNNTNMVVESSMFQLQLKDSNSNIVGIIDFDGVVLPSTGNILVTVDITGDITNVKDIDVDYINYTMKIQEVN